MTAATASECAGATLSRSHSATRRRDRSPRSRGSPGGAERERTFPASTYLSPILLGVKLRRMGERYVHATKFRSHCQPPSTVIDVRRCDPYRPPALARDHPSGRVVPSGAPLLRAPAVVPQAPRTYLQRTTTRPEARLRAGRYDPTGYDRAGGPRCPGSAPWKPVEALTEPSNGHPRPRSDLPKDGGPRRGTLDRSRRGTGPISARNSTDLDAEPDRSRRGCGVSVLLRQYLSSVSETLPVDGGSVAGASGADRVRRRDSSAARRGGIELIGAARRIRTAAVLERSSRWPPRPGIVSVFSGLLRCCTWEGGAFTGRGPVFGEIAGFPVGRRVRLSGSHVR